MKNLHFLIFLSLSIAQVIPPDDPVYIYLRQEFRRNHDLSLFFHPYPFSFKLFNGYKYLPSGQNAVIQFIPKIKIWNDIPISTVGIWASGHWENLSLIAEPVVVPDDYGETLLGTEYTRTGVSGRLTNAFIRYELSSVILQLGRSPIWWGQSWKSSIIQSGNTPSYDHLDIRLNLGSFQFEILAGQLGSEQSFNGNRVRRNIAGHRLTWLPSNKKWIIGFGEQIIYTGVNRSFEWTYLNPVVPYFFTALEEDEESTVSRDNDNSIVFAHGRYVINPSFSVFGEFILDDYQVDENDTPNSLGWKLGLDGGKNLFGRELTFEMEFTHIDNWMYIHHGEFTSWQNRGHAIGYEYGPDNWSLMFLAEYWLRPDILLTIKNTYLEKGANTLATEWDSPGTKGAPFPTPPVTIYRITNLSLAWHAKYGIIEIGWSNEPFSSEIAYGSLPSKERNSRSEKGGVYLKAQLIWGFGFDLE